MMRRDPAVIAAELSVDGLRQRFPAGSTRQVFVVDGRGGFCGIIDPGDVSVLNDTEAIKTVGELVSQPAPFLLPSDNLRTALDRFSQYALRCYARELERRRGGRQDDAGIFSPASGEITSGPKQP
jgi:hypothetical protein